MDNIWKDKEEKKKKIKELISMLKDYFLLVFGNLKSKGVRSLLTILGIFIGIAAVVSLISLGQGLQAAVGGQFGALSIDTLTVQNKGAGFGPPGSTVVEKLNDDDLKIIESIQGVDKVITRLIRVGSLEYNKISGFGFSSDIPEDKEDRNFFYNSFNIEAEKGRLLEGGDKGKIVLGNSFLESKEFNKKFEIGKTAKFNGKDFEIVGILKQSNSFQLNGVVFMMSNDLENLFGIRDEFDLIVVQVKDKDKIEDVAREIERKIRKDRSEKIGEESFTVESPVQALDSVNTILGIINIIVIGIAAISLLVGGIGIANTMYTSVLERTKEIGVMKAIGAQNKDILLIFMIEAGLLGLIGGFIGAIAGLLGAIGLSSVANNALGSDLFTVNISYLLIFGAIGFSFFIGIISGILPALQASKLNVVDALRN
jgi:putative ABC transport system permease protein